MEKCESMENSIYKNIQELSELCVDYGINNAYDLMEIIEKYVEIFEKTKENGGEICLILE